MEFSYFPAGGFSLPYPDQKTKGWAPYPPRKSLHPNNDCSARPQTVENARRYKKKNISSFEQISKKNPKIPFESDHSKFEFLECCLKNADIPRATPPGDLAYSRNREIRISTDRLRKGFFWIFRKSVQKQQSSIFRIFNLDKSHEIELLALLLSPYGPETMPILYMSKTTSKLWYRDLCTTKSDPSFHKNMFSISTPRLQ